MTLAEMEEEKQEHVRPSRPGLKIHTVTFIHISLAKVGQLAKPRDEMEEVHAIHDNEAMAPE